MTPTLHLPRELSDFRLMTLSFECRYPSAYLLWDRAGTVWSELIGLKPDLRLIKAEPGETVFRLDEHLEFCVQLGSFHLTAHNPSSVEEFARVADEFSSLVLRALGIGTLTRIGFRQIFVREFPELDGASAAMLALDLVRLPASPCFGIGAPPSNPRYAIRLEEESKGCTIQVYVHSRDFEPQLPFGWEGAEIQKVQRPTLSVDFDYYALSATVHQMRPEEWILQAAHVIRRDAGQILGGNKRWP